MSLPARPEFLHGLRAARWIRESTGRQIDKYGPAAQRAMQDRAIAELGLADTGLAWTVARSGWSGPDSMIEPPATKTPEFQAMLAAATRSDFDVLVVGYASRYFRDLALALHYRRFFQGAGVVVYLADDKLLSSNPDDWERIVDKLKAAEVSSRDQSKNVRSGYAAKKAQDNDPGGHPPFGLRRVPPAFLVEPDPDRLATIGRVVERSASGWTDRDVAADVGLSLNIVRGILTSSLYIGRLRDGSAANWGPLVNLDLWNRAQAQRAGRATNAGRPATASRPYALSMLHCSGCGRRLIGDTNYYRHIDACSTFTSATPDWPTSWKGRREGKGYARTTYEGIVEAILERVSLRADTLTRVIGRSVTPVVGPDRLALARIERERTAALDAYRRDRDSRTLDRTMGRLDAEESEARRQQPAEGVPTDVAVKYLRELALTWRRAEGGRGRRMLAEALFERIEVRGLREATLRLTDAAIAHGFAAVIPDRLELSVGYGRGERI